MSELPPVLDLEEGSGPRGLRDVPLRERAGMRRALQTTGSGLTALERALQGIERRLAPPGAPAPVQDASEPPAAPARIAEGLPARTRLETEWLAVPPDDGPRLLHHADLPLIQLGELAAHELSDGATTLTCGGIAPTIALPGPLDRHEMGRCPRCCAAIGYPPGFGSPKNDGACLEVLASRLEATT